MQCKNTFKWQAQGLYLGEDNQVHKTGCKTGHEATLLKMTWD